MLSSKEILETTNVGSPKTLTRWHQRGLIPPPEVRTHPSGRGKMAYWPGWVVWRIRDVKTRLDQGRGLDEIAQELGTDWDAEERRWARKRRSAKRAEDNERRRKATSDFAEAATTKVYEQLQAMGVQRPGVFARLQDRFDDLSIVRRALELCRDGYAPVAVILDERIIITTDFMVSSYLSATCRGILALPLDILIRDAFREIEKELPESPRFIAATCFEDANTGTRVQRTAIPAQDGKFKVNSAEGHHS